jgi:hypothetical protein
LTVPVNMNVDHITNHMFRFVVKFSARYPAVIAPGTSRMLPIATEPPNAYLGTAHSTTTDEDMLCLGCTSSAHGHLCTILVNHGPTTQIIQPNQVLAYGTAIDQ